MRSLSLSEINEISGGIVFQDTWMSSWLLRGIVFSGVACVALAMMGTGLIIGMGIEATGLTAHNQRLHDSSVGLGVGVSTLGIGYLIVK